MDAPLDTRNALRWHQERSFFLMNDDGLRGIVAWVPLTDVPPELGPLWVCPRSHTAGFVAPESIKLDYRGDAAADGESEASTRSGVREYT